MAILEEAIIGAISGQAILIFVYFSIYLIYHGKYIALIGVLWVFSFLRYVLILVIDLYPDYTFLTFFAELAGVLGTFFLLLGVFDFTKQKISKSWIFFFCLSIFWLLVFTLVPGSDFTVLTFLPYIFTGTANIWAGYNFIKSKQYKTFLKLLLGIFFIVWGLHKYDYPFLRMDTAFAPLGFLISTTLEFLIAINIILLYLYISRKNLLEVLEQLKKSADIQNSSLKQIVKNIESFTVLVDSIRNPLTVIMGITELKRIDQLDLILSETKKIENIVKELEQSWTESETLFKDLEKSEKPNYSLMYNFNK